MSTVSDYTMPTCPFCTHQVPAKKSDLIFIEHQYSNGPVSWVCPGSGMKGEEQE